jgi:hypothetical protein
LLIAPSQRDIKKREYENYKKYIFFVSRGGAQPKHSMYDSETTLKGQKGYLEVFGKEVCIATQEIRH